MQNLSNYNKTGQTGRDRNSCRPPDLKKNKFWWWDAVLAKFKDKNRYPFQSGCSTCSLDGLVPLLADHHLYLAIQSCEHLNRAW